MFEWRKNAPCSVFFAKTTEAVSDADADLAGMPELDCEGQDSTDTSGPGPPNPTVRYNGFDADKIDGIFCEARKTMQIRIYGNWHLEGSKVLNGTVTVYPDDELVFGHVWPRAVILRRNLMTLSTQHAARHSVPA